MMVPFIWKFANVMPLFKGGTHSSPSNYRPISLTSVSSKTMERLLVSQLYAYLDSNNLLSVSNLASVQDFLSQINFS